MNPWPLLFYHYRALSNSAVKHQSSLFPSVIYKYDWTWLKQTLITLIPQKQPDSRSRRFTILTKNKRLIPMQVIDFREIISLN
jgi:hypothetical protein